MRLSSRIAFALAASALALAACQGSFGSGGTSAPGGINPPVNAQAPNNPTQSPTPIASGSAQPSMPPGTMTTYAFAKGPQGLQCPQDRGFSCVLRFNVVNESPSPLPSGSSSPSASPTASASPSPTPSDASSSATPSASPTAAGPQITLALSALPKDAPAMVNPDTKAVATVPLVAIRMHTDADVLLQGKAIADFTLPKEQIGGRGFALQLFHEMTVKKKRKDSFFGSYAQSKLAEATLTFELTVPKIQVKKDETWLLVLYGDERPSESASPSAVPSPSASASGSPSSSPSASPSASPNE